MNINCTCALVPVSRERGLFIWRNLFDNFLSGNFYRGRNGVFANSDAILNHDALWSSRALPSCAATHEHSQMKILSMYVLYT
jgi:hypothetical protein